MTIGDRTFTRSGPPYNDPPHLQSTRRNKQRLTNHAHRVLIASQYYLWLHETVLPALVAEIGPEVALFRLEHHSSPSEVGHFAVLMGMKMVDLTEVYELQLDQRFESSQDIVNHFLRVLDRLEEILT